MKIILFLALMVSSYGYAQSSHDHASESSPKDNQHSDMHDHGSGHHGMGNKDGMMMYGGYYQLDSATLKHFFESLFVLIIDKKKNAALIALGKKLYLDPRLSINDTISCNSCHQLNNFGVDSQSISFGYDGTRG